MFIHRILALFMAFLVLWSSAGAAVYQHVCRSGGLYEGSLTEIIPCEKTAVAVHVKKSCCADESTADQVNTPSFSEECCVYDQIFTRVTTESTSLANTLFEAVIQTLSSYFVPAFFQVFYSGLTTVSSKLSYAFLSPVPLLSQGDPHALLQTFRC